ncbi:SpoIVB peptidase [Candidatus Agathobaculum pullicola]|uniref:SpoIVB peptidase n=1 Tax=Candidatus Agathobaculum pullicola TaxID=2838426 RepID=UPI003F92F7E0
MQQRNEKKIAISLILTLAMMVSAQAAEISSLIPIGHTVGIQMSAEGVLVVRLDDVQTVDGAVCPARDAGVQEGDLIVGVNGAEINANDDLQKQIALSGGQPVELTLESDGSSRTVTVTPCADQGGVYRIGVLARDGMAGIGTLTYVDPETGAYGSLGHGICDGETGVLIPLRDGSLIQSSVGSVQRGQAGEPGALQGEFVSDNAIGTVDENTESGIFGTLTDSSIYASLESVPVASADEIEVGDAEILTNVEGDAVEKYSVQVVKIYPEDDEYGRGMMLRVTDPELLEKTGGIVQGMSGSPVLQNGKLIGAVTHVLVNDPTCGYAIGIERMIEEMEN